ncbi:RsmB/NOP family class I SAM-dependent RNA methyltransferase [Taibaiella koreensis]|uniref:hypothetical protein n=1 Tax=Taibaiella koreensis TaxID=1268548 RepID=UPI000E59DF1F|nr:hypothetical protein [Taibaiella koreensis]
MSFFQDHILRIVQQYEGNPPLAVFLKQYFRQYPRLGSRDRKALSEAAYIYYRCRRFLGATVAVEDVIAQGISLCGSRNAFLQKMIPAQPASPAILLEQRSDFDDYLSPRLAADKWLRSLWQQPELFIRLRRDASTGKKRLQDANISFNEEALPGHAGGDCLKLPNGSAIDGILPPDTYVVQDWASQASIHLLLQKLSVMPATIWDVCSGAGGKSLLLKDIIGKCTQLATDIRASILHNLQQRFRLYGLGRVETLVLDSADAQAVAAHIGERQFDLVLCDVPCSGSGTWARTPEQFHFFRPQDLQKFRQLQYPIAANAAQYVAPGGMLAYITCSVFREENEAVVAQLEQTTRLKLVHQQLIDGIDRQADCLFLALFQREMDES